MNDGWMTVDQLMKSPLYVDGAQLETNTGRTARVVGDEIVWADEGNEGVHPPLSKTLICNRRWRFVPQKPVVSWAELWRATRAWAEVPHVDQLNNNVCETCSALHKAALAYSPATDPLVVAAKKIITDIGDAGELSPDAHYIIGRDVLMELESALAAREAKS